MPPAVMVTMPSVTSAPVPVAVADCPERAMGGTAYIGGLHIGGGIRGGNSGRCVFIGGAASGGAAFAAGGKAPGQQYGAYDNG